MTTFSHFSEYLCHTKRYKYIAGDHSLSLPPIVSVSSLSVIGVTVPLFGLGKLVCSANVVLRVLSEQANIFVPCSTAFCTICFCISVANFSHNRLRSMYINVLGWLVYRSCVCVCVCERKSVCMSYTFWECVCVCEYVHFAFEYDMCSVCTVAKIWKLFRRLLPPHTHRSLWRVIGLICEC